MKISDIRPEIFALADETEKAIRPVFDAIDETALITDAFFCSAGRRGAQIGIDPEALAEYIGARFADLTET